LPPLPSGTDAEELEVAISGVPFDAEPSISPGVRYGPRGV
jgi:arginase family enzyme